jgi:hypothetical protein
MTTPQTPRKSPRSRTGRGVWLVGTILLLGGGALVGMVLGSVWVGLVLGAAVSIGWLIAYESRRGHHVGLDDEDDDGAEL